jgi:hypothetical protein
MVVEEEGGVKDCTGSCEKLFCWPFLVSRQMVMLVVPVQYLFLRRVIIITGKEKRNGQILRNSGAVFLLEHCRCSVPFGTLDLLLVCNLRNSTVTRCTAPRVFQKVHCTRSAPPSFFLMASDTQISNAIRACMQPKQMMTRLACARQELCSFLPGTTINISSQSPSCSAMPDMQLSTKMWGKVDGAALAKLVHSRDVDINNLSTAHIDAVRKEHFCHYNKKNFRRNFRDFAATFDLEAKYSRARKRAGKTMHFRLLYISII